MNRSEVHQATTEKPAARREWRVPKLTRLNAGATALGGGGASDGLTQTTSF